MTVIAINSRYVVTDEYVEWGGTELSVEKLTTNDDQFSGGYRVGKICKTTDHPDIACITYTGTLSQDVLDIIRLFTETYWEDDTYISPTAFTAAVDLLKYIAVGKFDGRIIFILRNGTHTVVEVKEGKRIIHFTNTDSLTAIDVYGSGRRELGSLVIDQPMTAVLMCQHFSPKYGKTVSVYDRKTDELLSNVLVTDTMRKKLVNSVYQAGMGTKSLHASTNKYITN